MSYYTESETLKQAKKKTQDHEAARPSYTSRWEKELENSLAALENRSFSYDPAADPAYDAYRRSYKRKGALAMADTLGKSTALTGGYGNSWAQTAAQESYEDYMHQLTDKIPQLYQLAQDRYDRETEDLRARYEAFLAREEQDRESFDETFDRWLRELEDLRDAEQAIAKEDYDRYQADREFAAKYPNAPAQKPGSSGSSGSSDDGLPAPGSYDNAGVDPEDIKKIQAALGVEPDGKWGRESYIAAGHVTADIAWQNYLSEFG
ncbi:MAG: hypothetical protein IJN53_01590 [Oscillospiraceae bacterium]|nr:hypothetical protein [Oscillospiraceae bacterium]